MRRNELKYLVLNDIHLGHKKNPTVDIIAALKLFIGNYETRNDISIIFLAGDVFDTLLDLSDDDVFEITKWILSLIQFCHRKNIKLRVLEGTPRHDHGQSKLFESVKNATGLPVDLKYIHTLHIEYMEDEDLYILYVPDEWNASTDKTFEQVQVLLKECNIDKVDISIMHGLFGYQITASAKTVPKHLETNYLDITRYYIHIGHVHLFSVYERIIAGGSFDCIRHNEEQPKGGIEACIYKDGRMLYWFIENKVAKKFVTFTIKNKDMDSVLKYLTRKINKLPLFSHVRLKTSKNHPCYTGIDYIKSYFPAIHFTLMALEDEVEDDYQLISDTVVDDVKFIPITLTQENLKTLLFDDIQQNHVWTPKQWELAEHELTELMRA